MKYDSKGRITREGMELAIKSGGSAIYNGNIINNVKDLPSAQQMAAASGDSGEVDRVRKENEATIKRLQQENQQLREHQDSQAKAQADAARLKAEADAKAPPAK